MNGNNRHRRLGRRWILCAIGLAGCGSQSNGTEPSELGKVSEPIINGYVVTTDTIGTPLIGVLDPSGNWGCSGTMIKPQWLLTARHCVTQGELRTGGTAIAARNVIASIKDGNNSALGVQIVRHPTLDAALVFLDSAPLDSGGHSFANPFYRGSTSALVPHVFYTQGWGANNLTHCTPSADGSGGGTLRSAALQVQQMLDSSRFQTIPNTFAGQIDAPGDSGSSLFATVAGIQRPFSVLTTFDCTQNPLQIVDAQHVRGDAIRSWVDGVTGNAPVVGSPAGGERSDTASAIPYVISGRVHELCIGGPCGTNWHFGDLGVSDAASSLSAYVRADSVSTVVYRSTGNDIIELRLEGTTWRSGNLSFNTNTSQGAVGNPAGYTRSDNYSSVVYRGSDRHIRELFLPPGTTTWQVRDLSDLSGAPAAASDPVGYVRSDAINAVVYRSVLDGHIREITWDPPTQKWQVGDLTLLVGISQAAIGTPRPYSRSDGFNAVVYQGIDDHIYELGLPLGSTSWQVGDLTKLAGAPISASDPSPYIRFDSWNTVIYRGIDGHINELGLAPGSTSWHWGDLTQRTGAPIAADMPSGYVRDNTSAIDFRRASDNHIFELSLNGTTWHPAVDLTARAGGP
ncbi:MAG: S1 family peptidase [Myxococcota bacterium]|nr:S1 family peptidase [Myxococcota bacterium]